VFEYIPPPGGGLHGLSPIRFRGAHHLRLIRMIPDRMVSRLEGDERGIQAWKNSYPDTIPDSDV